MADDKKMIAIITQDLDDRLAELLNEEFKSEVVWKEEVISFLTDLDKNIVEVADPKYFPAVQQKQNDMQVPVYLTVYGWHVLLRELEQIMCIVNRDKTNVEKLIKNIGNQLNGQPLQEPDDNESQT